MLERYDGEMLKQLARSLLLLGILSACSVLAQPQPAPTQFALVATPTSPATPTTEPTPTPAPDLPALWLMDSAMNRLVAVDPRTGKVLNTLSRTSGLAVTSQDGRWQFTLETVRKGDRWNVSVLALDLTRSASPRRFAVMDMPAQSFQAAEEITAQSIVLTDDQRELLVSQMEKQDGQFITRVYILDVVKGALARTIDVSDESLAAVANYPLPAQSLLTRDGLRLVIIRNQWRTPPAARNDPAVWFTRIIVVSLKAGQPEQTLDVPGDIRAHGLWLNTRLAPDGKMIYLLQEIVRERWPDGYRFVEFDLSQRAVARVQVVESSQGGDVACNTWNVRFTSDGRYLYGYCPADHPIRPAGYVQYLDIQTGLLEAKAVLESKINPSETAPHSMSYVLSSPDNHLLYIVYWKSREVFVFDVAQRKVLRTTIVKEPKATFTNPFDTLVGTVTNWFVGVASAKFYAQPAVLLSPDGQRLYIVDIVDLERGNGLWVIETSTLKTLGHWLAGKDISGILLSQDGRELFAASPNDYGIYALDAQTGETLHVLKQEQTAFKPMGFVTAQSY